MNNEELVLLYQQGDKQALESLINSNMGIVKKLALKFSNINKMVELDDLIQVGYIGLINAANRYKTDIDHPAAFITFAFLIIKQEILACINGRSLKDVANNKFYNNCKSLNIQVGNEEDAELVDLIDSHDNSMEIIEDKIYFKQLRNELEEAMTACNTLLERQVLKLHYGWDIKSIILREIGEMLNIDTDKAALIENMALRKLRNSKWGRTLGRKYIKALVGDDDITYRSVEKRIDLDRYFDGECRNVG